jgi:hypothetical protein
VIETPEVEEWGEFAVKVPSGWGYRSLSGRNGLVGVLWPAKKSFNKSDTAIFVFLQNDGETLPKKPNNIQILVDKCPKLTFHFSTAKGISLETENDSKEKEFAQEDETISIAEEFFSGRCGRTMILFKEVVSSYSIVVALISGRYVSLDEFNVAKHVTAAYREEVMAHIKALSGEDGNEDKSDKDAEKGNKAEGVISKKGVVKAKNKRKDLRRLINTLI